MRFIVAVFLIIIFLFLTELYFFKRLLPGAKLIAKKIKIPKKYFTVLIIFINLYPTFLIIYFFISKLSNFSFFTLPNGFLIDWFLVYPFWISLIIIIQTDLVLILLDILQAAVRLLNKNKDELNVLFQKIRFAFFVIFLLYVPVRIVYDYYSVDVTHITFEKGSLPKALDGFKIALISDIHADRYTDKSRIGSYVNKVNSEKPDLILIAGDIISRGNKYIQSAAQSLSKLNAAYGVYSCVGDHDNWAYRRNYKRSLKEVKSALAAAGIQMLDNKIIFIPVDSAKIQVSFATNNYVSKIAEKDLGKLKIDSTADITIFLTHQPRERLILFASEQCYDFYFCGHTHGGQITFLFPFYNLTPTLLETPFTRGAYQVNSLFVYVVRGLGMSIAPIRYNSAPEILVLTLHKG